MRGVCALVIVGSHNFYFIAFSEEALRKKSKLILRLHHIDYLTKILAMCLSCSTHLKHGYTQLPSPTCPRSFTSLNEYPFHSLSTPRSERAPELGESLSPPPPPHCKRVQFRDDLPEPEVPLFIPDSQSLIKDDSLKKRTLERHRCLEKTSLSSTFRLKPRPASNPMESSMKLSININEFPSLPFSFGD